MTTETEAQDYDTRQLKAVQALLETLNGMEKGVCRESAAFTLLVLVAGVDRALSIVRG